MNRLIVCAAVAALALPLAGCGSGRPKTAVVRGTVTFKGQPVPNGTVMFVPAGGTAATGEIGPDGSYSLTTFAKGDGAILGRHKVVIVALRDVGLRGAEDRTPLPPPIVPDKYLNVATTDLTADVQDRDNTIDFELKDDKKK